MNESSLIPLHDLILTSFHYSTTTKLEKCFGPFFSFFCCVSFLFSFFFSLFLPSFLPSVHSFFFSFKRKYLFFGSLHNTIQSDTQTIAPLTFIYLFRSFALSLDIHGWLVWCWWQGISGQFSESFLLCHINCCVILHHPLNYNK